MRSTARRFHRLDDASTVRINNAGKNADNHEGHSDERLGGVGLAENEPTDRDRVDESGVIDDRDTGRAFLLQRVCQEDLAEL